MDRNNRGNLWAIMSTVAGIGLLVLLYFSTSSDAQFGLFGSKRPQTLIQIFIEGTELYKKYEYKEAKKRFDYVLTRINELKPQQQEDLRGWIKMNDAAIVGQDKYEATLVKGETAEAQKRYEEAWKCVRELEANPYGSPAMRERLRHSYVNSAAALSQPITGSC